MAYAENEKKFVAVLNRKHELPRLLNGLGHATAGLVGRMSENEGDFLDYPNDADGFTATVSRYPFIILRSDNGSKLAALRKAAAEKGVAENVFVSAMIGTSAADQIEKTKAASGSDLDYMVIVLFGEAALLDPMTKKFSLFKGL